MTGSCIVCAASQFVVYLHRLSPPILRICGSLCHRLCSAVLFKLYTRSATGLPSHPDCLSNDVLLALHKRQYTQKYNMSS